MYLGQDFTKSYKLSIFPAGTLPAGNYQLTISYMTEKLGVTTLHRTDAILYNPNSQDFIFTFGRDVYCITIELHRELYLFGKSNIPFFVNFSIRVDHLAMLNLVVKLLKLQPTPLKGSI